ncbi:dynein regulatory complex subunit 3 [Conger conger]|uniref:dynein regulatory complex subunit 3 n=1 Tax=Conger conger TaxID=82655 RepID=UPI002A5AC83C|nr:dynein regulatory complex subunit 3 [Conger conger]
MIDTDEPTVVDEEMLQQAVEEQGPKGQAGVIAKQETIELKDVLHLRLDYRHILKIDHLWQFTSLTKLQLDNNIIEKITGLEFLTNLVWLDLSFNHIEAIEGLEALVKLEDLSLSNNSISTMENMDTLVNLHVLSICNNKLTQLDNVIYLRKFKNLRALNLAGNPVSTEECYKEFIAVYLPDLAYLDFRLLNEQTREEAMAKYQYALEELIHNETQELRVIEAKNQKEEELQQHREAFVDLLNGSQLFEGMYADDTEAERLAYLPGVPMLVDAYQNQMVALCVQLFELGLVQKRARDEEVKCFFDCFHEAVEDNQQVASEIIVDFEKARREMLLEMQRMMDREELLARIGQGSKETCDLHDELMTLELQLADQLEDVVKDFERNISDMVASFIEAAQGIFAQCRDLENIHNEKLLEISMATLEKVAKNELEEESQDELRALLVDKDTVMSAIGASHDTHLLKIDNREDELVTRINSWVASLMKTIHHDEVARNRKRIAEIHNYIDNVKEKLDDLNPS